jgi:hypothetical protein
VHTRVGFRQKPLPELHISCLCGSNHTRSSNCCRGHNSRSLTTSSKASNWLRAIAGCLVNPVQTIGRISRTHRHFCYVKVGGFGNEQTRAIRDAAYKLPLQLRFDVDRLALPWATWHVPFRWYPVLNVVHSKHRLKAARSPALVVSCGWVHAAGRVSGAHEKGQTDPPRADWTGLRMCQHGGSRPAIFCFNSLTAFSTANTSNWSPMKVRTNAFASKLRRQLLFPNWTSRWPTG